MILYANGCSHTAGAEMFHAGDYDVTENKQHAFPALLGHALGVVEVVNDARSGQSNNAILMQTMEWVANWLKKPDREDLFVLIHWTGWERFTFVDKQVDYRFVAGMDLRGYSRDIKDLFDLWCLYMTDYSWVGQRMLTDILGLQSFLKTYHIHYLFVNAIEATPRFPPYVGLSALVDEANYLSPWEHNETFFHRLLKEGFSHIPGSAQHFGEDAHQWWAAKLFVEINKRGLLND